MRIIGYTYCADIHCPACTREDAAVGLLTRKPPLVMDTDEHGLAFPIYDIMEHDFTHCGDCHEELT
jgi:hypothetical protein